MKTGQKILFRGLDDPLKITSIMVTVGVLCWVWIEEAYEIMEDDFDKIEGSIRGLMPEGSGLWKQFTLTFNPWSDKSWLKRRFFDVTDDPRIFTKRVTYLCNEWLDDSDREHYEIMKTRNPRRYAVEGLGEWGTVDGLVYENYDVDYFNKDEIKSKPGVKAVFGLDFGYTNDPSAFVCSLVDTKEMVIYVFDEFSETQLSNTKIAEKITAMGYQKERIVADSAEPKSIDDLYTLGIRRIEKSRKGKDSILNGIQYIQDFKIIVHPKCVNFAREIAVYSWQKDRFGHTLNKPVDTDNHSMDALRYSMQNIKSGSNFSFE